MTLITTASRTGRIAALTLATLLVACGGGGAGGDASSTPAPAPSPTPAPSPPPPPPPPPVGAFGPALSGTSTVSMLDVGLIAPQLLPGQTAPTYAGRYLPMIRHHAVGDVNGDGRPDIVICPSFFAYLPMMSCEAWLNRGDGGFRLAAADEVFDGGAPPIGGGSPWLGDFNGDGRTDLFLLSGGIECRVSNPPPGCDVSQHRVLYGQPDGRLKDASATALAADPDPALHHSSGYGDFDGDGVRDIAVCDLGVPFLQRNFGIYLLRGRPDGVFERITAGLPQDIASTNFDTRDMTVDWFGCGVTTLVDLDGDGRDELVTSTYINGLSGGTRYESRVYQRQASGTWELKATIPFPTAVSSLVASNGTRPGGFRIVHGDLNGDGRNDLVLAFESIDRGDHVQILRNDGNFQFTDRTLAWLGSHEIGFRQAQDTGYTRAMPQAIRDLNGDGIPDLQLDWGGFFHNALADKSPFWLNDGTGRLQRWMPTFGGARFTGQALADPQWTGLLGIPYTNPTSLLVFDVDGDGLQDWVFIDNLDPNPAATPQIIDSTYTEARIYIRVVRQVSE